MKFPSSFLLLLSLLALAACSPSSQEVESSYAEESPIPAKAEVDRFISEGPEHAARELRPLDYWLHYKMMQATGMEEALGGEEQTVAALKAIGIAYEQRLKSFKAETPRMIPASFTGEGMDAGFLGMGFGTIAGVMSGGLFSGPASQLSDQQLAEIAKAGPMKFAHKDGSAEFQMGEDGSLDQMLEFTVDENGVSGKTKMKMKMKIEACPDATGKLTIAMDIDSSMRVSGKAGTGGYVRSQLRYERYLDDDAHLIEDNSGIASEMHIEMGGFENYKGQHMNVTLGLGHDGKGFGTRHGDSGFNILFRPEEVTRANTMLKQAYIFQAAMAEFMLRGMGSKQAPWESGHCVDLKVNSDPAKRKGAKPNTTYSLLAEPRAKADGAPTGGTVRATLTGKSSLTPDNSPVKADATFTYSNPTEKNQSASISFEARSKRGVGRATLEFDTKEGKSYRITGIGDCPGPWDVCDTTKPFTFPVCGGVMTHTPKSDAGGSQTFSHSGAHGSGSYSFSGPEEKMTVTYRTTTCAMGKCYGPLVGTAIWTKIDSCE